MSYKEERKLSTKDLMRKKRFNALCDKMKSAGYNVQNLFYYELGTVGLANLLSFPFAFLLVYFYLLHNADISDSAFGYRVGLLFAYLFTFLTNIRSGVLPYPIQLFFFILIYLLAISMDDAVENIPLFIITGGVLPYICSFLLFEQIHKMALAHFAKGGQEDVESVFSSGRLTSYYITLTPLSKRNYMCVALIPLVLTLFLGIAASYLSCFGLYIFAQMMIFLSGYDLLLLIRLLTHWVKGSDIQYIEHPIVCGLVAFVKKND